MSVTRPQRENERDFPALAPAVRAVLMSNGLVDAKVRRVCEYVMEWTKSPDGKMAIANNNLPRGGESDASVHV